MILFGITFFLGLFCFVVVQLGAFTSSAPLHITLFAQITGSIASGMIIASSFILKECEDMFKELF